MGKNNSNRRHSNTVGGVTYINDIGILKENVGDALEAGKNYPDFSKLVSENVKYFMFSAVGGGIGQGMHPNAREYNLINYSGVDKGRYNTGNEVEVWVLDSTVQHLPVQKRF